ncbi:hypothetical protein KI387_044042 [Taxus chinensis]|uniref:RNase H type-1 domain-containing protein n=1 Tax=Taxus chinensis TaxID=29808 RepID=A0AA38G1C4_TAXCH|nr:hypothetical protein KI387_044042 [Taxus chinensis]
MHGIEVNPAKVKDILEILPPTNICQILILQGKLQSIIHFISQLYDHCEPFHHLLKKYISFKWDDECHKAFEALKKYLLQPPVLIPPKDDQPFYLYISATNHSLGAMLAHHDEQHREQAVYYISFTLMDYETRYTHAEKLCLALVFVTTKLLHYLLNHKTFIITNIDPLHYMYAKPYQHQHATRWLMLLADLNLEFIHQNSIKGQAITDQLANAPIFGNQPSNFNFPDESIAALSLDEPTYQMTLFFDGSKCQRGGGAGVILIPLDGEPMPLSFKLNFDSTNNIAEYEALILGLQDAYALDVKSINIFGYSQLLVINQVNGIYQCHNEILQKYKHHLDIIFTTFDHYAL